VTQTSNDVHSSQGFLPGFDLHNILGTDVLPQKANLKRSTYGKGSTRIVCTYFKVRSEPEVCR
jgi:hypothetical protein